MDAATKFFSNELRFFVPPDSRIYTRSVMVGASLCRSPESSINQASGGPAMSKAAYRFFNNSRVSADDMLESHVSSTVSRIEALKEPYVLVPVDTSFLNYDEHSAKTDLGVIGTRRSRQSKGIILHHSLALSMTGEPLGFLERQLVYRPERADAGEERRKNQLKLSIEEKESFRWIQSIRSVQDSLSGTGVTPIFIADREADNFSIFKEATSFANSEFLIRARGERKIAAPDQDDEDEWNTLTRLLVQSEDEYDYSFDVSRISARNKRVGRVPRTAHCKLKWLKFDALSLKSRTQQVVPDLYVVHLREVGRNKDDSIGWVLITSLPITSLADAEGAIQMYRQRWQIENFHRVLKDGCRIEDCQLESKDGLERFIMLKAIAAFHIYVISRVSRSDPERTSTDFFSEEEINIICALTQPRGTPLPKTPPSCKEIVRRIAMRGGFLGRKGDGDPGMIAIWRGLQIISLAFEVAHTMAHLKKEKCG